MRHLRWEEEETRKDGGQHSCAEVKVEVKIEVKIEVEVEVEAEGDQQVVHEECQCWRHSVCQCVH